MAKLNLTDQSALFKNTYQQASTNSYNSDNVVLGTIKKNYKFVGKKKEINVPLSFAGGVGSGSLPTANPASYDTIEITAKKVYAVTEYEREAIKAAGTDEGAFFRATKEPTKKAVESFNRNASRILWGDGTGALGTFSGNATGSATAPVLTIISTDWNVAHWEEKDYVNVNTLSSVFEITAVDETNRQITLSRISGSDDLTAIGAGTHTVYMQNSKDNDPMGIKGVVDATSGSVYGISVARRWQSYRYDANGAGVTAAVYNNLMLQVHKKCGKYPNMFVASYEQYEKTLNFLEDQKEYTVKPRDKKLHGRVSFTGIKIMTPDGPRPLFMDRFVDSDRIYALNTNYIESHHRPDFGWFDDDGTVFLRKASSDDYEGRYGGYYENVIWPTFQGVAHSLAT